MFMLSGPVGLLLPGACGTLPAKLLVEQVNLALPVEKLAVVFRLRLPWKSSPAGVTVVEPGD
jgi:hypothetical protein